MTSPQVGADPTNTSQLWWHWLVWTGICFITGPFHQKELLPLVNPCEGLTGTDCLPEGLWGGQN